MLALCDAIRGYERELRGGIPVKEINSFKIPSSHIIQRASGLAAHQFHIILDLLRVLLMADERRVAHHIRAFITGQQKTDEVITIVTRERSRHLGVAASSRMPSSASRVPNVLLCMNEPPCMAGSYRHR